MSSSVSLVDGKAAVRRVQLGLAISLLASVVGCGQSRAPLELEAVIPATVTTMHETPARLRGHNLFNAVHVRMDSSEAPAMQRKWAVTIGSLTLAEESVTWIDEHNIDLVIPAGLPLGAYALGLTSPDGASATLPRALSVEGLEALSVSIESAPQGQGAALQIVDVPEGQQREMFAVLRDRNAHFVADADVEWSVTQQLGVVEATAGAGAIFIGALAGEGTIVAQMPPATAGEVQATVRAACATDAECADPCRSGNRCIGGGCHLGPIDLDVDGDGAAAAWCGGSDCDDDPTGCGAQCFPNNQIPDTCDGLDQDCDGAIDEDYAVISGCGIGYCGAASTPSSCVAGVEAPCQPALPISGSDPTCDGVDDDCDGVDDDDYVIDASVGIGHCFTTNTPSSCIGGVEHACQPGSPLGPNDATCDGVDDDCDGSIDEDYLADKSCGVGHCATTSTPSSCNGGSETPCQPGAPLAGTDATCDGVDDDCSGASDEDYVTDTSCGVGHCGTTNTPSNCVAGVEAACQPGAQLAANDTSCDGVDDDCDGVVDDDYVVDGACGVGYCQTTNTPSSCVGGSETSCQASAPLASDDTSCDGVDDDCDGSPDEDYSGGSTSCGVGECLGNTGNLTCTGGVVDDSCNPRAGSNPEGPQASCSDGLDNDCDGDTDDTDADCCGLTCSSCSGGGCCSDTCGANGNCFYTCHAGSACGCSFDCSDTADCDAWCWSGTTCDVDCSNSASCEPWCSGSDCEIDCSGAAFCSTYCRFGAECLIDCTGSSSCSFSQCDGGETSCPNNIIVCNRACP